ncbi:hypothetical protein [Flavonifractor sp. An100]|uniref:hypothetical protein n=1 Tax=Flavonifractor sp. An100 TaxID=1965538 RepID=UPI000B380E1E|nr:hypothetical protein [Flavonifractor sp. An100]OUQ80609.1 hypothetical protein B5E43_03670 [Flavonifractor sp. An100]
MLDDLIELVLDLAVDLGGAAAKGKRKQGGQKTEHTQKPAEKQEKKTSCGSLGPAPEEAPLGKIRSVIYV